MTQEELFQINTLHRDIQIYEAVKKEDTLINVGSFSENERQVLYKFMEQRCEALKADFAALRVEAENNSCTNDCATRSAHWMYNDREDLICSNCWCNHPYDYDQEYTTDANYCPRCGAKMIERRRNEVENKNNR